MSSLFKKMSDTVANSSIGFLSINLDDIVVKKQARVIFNDDDLELLASSILSVGRVLQNIVVCKHGSKYLLVSGERRFRACRMLVSREHLDFQMIPAFVVQNSDADSILRIQAVENSARVNLHPIERLKHIFSWRDTINNSRGWKAEYCKYCAMFESDFSLIYSFRNYSNEFLDAVLVNGLRTLRRIKTLHGLAHRSLVVSLLRDKKSFADIVGQVSKLDVGVADDLDSDVLVADNNVEDDSVSKADVDLEAVDDGVSVSSKVSLGDVDADKLKLFYSFLLAKDIDVGGDLVGFIQRLDLLPPLNQRL